MQRRHHGAQAGDLGGRGAAHGGAGGWQGVLVLRRDAVRPGAGPGQGNRECDGGGGEGATTLAGATRAGVTSGL
jgi:hypothetical protein